MWFLNPPSGPISALDTRIKSAKYCQYSSGLNLVSALTLNLIEGFKTTLIF